MDTDFSPQPHQEAIDLIQGKPPVTRAVFDEMLPELRGRVFTVTGIEGANVLQRVRDAIAGLPAGKTWDQAKDDVVAELDPFLGEGAEGRAELLLRTHAFQAFQASNWRVAQEDVDTTHLQYLATEDDRVRDSHLALNGIILPKDDPFWDEHYPPWEWNCRCRVRPMNPDLVDEARQQDEQRSPDDQLVMEGPSLRKLNEGTLIRDGRAYDVTSPAESDPNAFQWHPDNLRLPLAELKARYDPEVWAQFEAYAKSNLMEDGQSVWDWLSQRGTTPGAVDNITGQA